MPEFDVRFAGAPVPDGAPGAHLIILLHGFGADESDMAQLAPFLPAGSTVAAIRAPVQLPPELGSGRAWYPLQLGPTGVVDDPSYAAAAAADAEQVLAWLAGAGQWQRVSIGGFSQGASVALAAMAARPTAAKDWLVLSGFAVPSGTEPPPTQPLPRVFWSRDEADPMIPARWTKATEQWLDGRAAVSAHTYPGLGHAIDGRVIGDLNAFLAEL